MSTTCYRNHEDDVKRVHSLQEILHTTLTADYNLPKSIFVTYPGTILSEADRREVTKLGWSIQYDMHMNKTTLKTEHARLTDFMFVWTWVLLAILCAIVYHGMLTLFFYWQKNETIEFT